MNLKNLMLAGLAMAAVGTATGCRVDSHKDGNSDNVKIATPFGGMSVKTNDATVLEGLALPVYPGAAEVKKDDKDNGSADVNMSFGNFRLRVKAASFTTPDSQDKVQAFYKNALGRFGNVIQCANNKPVGTPVRTDEGLTCDSEHGNHISVDDDMNHKLELKAGSKQHQHIVAIEPQAGGTKFGLVALDLPGNFSMGKDDEDSKQ